MGARLLALALVVVRAAPAHATETGIDIGHVVDDGVLHDHTGDVASTGAGWVRINLRLDAWSAPDDATPRGPDQLTWFEAYDRIVDAYLARGIQIYGLVNDEAVASSLDPNDDAWIALYVQNAVKIIDHFKNRIRVFEILNEPNNWVAGTTQPRFSPRSFAKVLQDTYLAVKRDHASDRCWQVDLISGPLFSFDGVSSADYLQQTYAAGKSQLAWDYTHQVTGGYPLDGIGYHMYVAQGLDSATTDVDAAMTQNMDAVWSAITAGEGGATAKRMWVSEYGWQASVVGDDVQAARLQAGFDTLRGAGVALAVYFNFQDFPGATYGLFSNTGHRRAGADTLQAISEANLPARAARIVGVALPALGTGEVGDAIVTLENRGADAWTDGFRLAAAPGCPDATVANEVEWVPSAGYANSVLDARVLVPEVVPPGGTIALHVPIRAPAREGNYTFAARMVDEGVAFFGTTASATLAVDHGGSGTTTGTASTPQAAAGCSAGGTPGLAMALFGLGMRRRRRLQ